MDYAHGGTGFKDRRFERPGKRESAIDKVAFIPILTALVVCRIRIRRAGERAVAKAETKSYIVHVAELKDGGLRYDVDLDREELEELLVDLNDEFSPGDGLECRLQLSCSGDLVSVRGRVDVKLRYSCCRCLADVETERSISMRWTLIPEAKYRKEAKHVEEVELAAEDLEVAFYRGKEVDLGDIIRQAVLLELEPFPVCPDECKGEIESIATTASTQDDIDPRWAPLLSLKNRGN